VIEERNRIKEEIQKKKEQKERLAEERKKTKAAKLAAIESAK